MDNLIVSNCLSLKSIFQGMDTLQGTQTLFG